MGGRLLGLVYYVYARSRRDCLRAPPTRMPPSAEQRPNLHTWLDALTKPSRRCRTPSYSGVAMPVAAACPALKVAVSQPIVDAAVAAQPARQLAMRIGAAQRVDLGDIGRVAGEFEDQPIRRVRVDRFAITVI